MTEQELTALSIAIGVLKREGIFENAEVLKGLRTRLSISEPSASIADTAGAKPIYQVQDPCEGTWEDTDWLTYESTDGAFKRIVYAHPSAEIAALREQIAGMEKDAERYRYVRGVIAWDPDRYDSAIDAAIAKEQK